MLKQQTARWAYASLQYARLQDIGAEMGHGMCVYPGGWAYMYKHVPTLCVVDVDVLCRSRMAAAHSHVIYTFHVL